MDVIYDKLRIKPETMLKSMITTTTVILYNLIKETEKKFSISYLDLHKYFDNKFELNFRKVLLERGICTAHDVDLATKQVTKYVMEFLDDICEHGSDLYFKNIITKNTRILIMKFADIFPIEQQNMIMSNSISVVLLTFIDYLLDMNSKESVNLIIKSVIGKMGEYSASSLESYIVDSEDNDIDKIVKVIKWVFINGNPDMNISLEDKEDNKFVIIQNGVCRQYVNAEILGIKNKIYWPINLESFIEIVRYFSKDMKLYFDKKQCMGDPVCRLVCCRETDEREVK